ncbi:hypothetical protein BO70DRAFT_405833 [Aspergillus heteromorphus CBS 117.55]|uniref:Uncharacterized protein n=1 Tax=Aspergillus heteromorphus CBS 117.55 TaxID=1448321 RepID=A0A317ULA1_9EURO|nr:uncharacterized protein BO70DRAFT_405833 [Aspergillus heteromorphus CBS 117.55]PWY62481.1 hypothetical protein BO70DRAFT_405833 [Aspergillus heteromorphus CBS 117.55]
MWILHGNVTERGDVGGGPGKSSLFFLTAYHPEIGLSGARVLWPAEPRTFAGSVFTPGRTHNRSRSPRVGSLGLGGTPRSRGALAGQPAGAPQHRVGDALGRLRPSGGRLTTNLELVRTRGI